ncbi:MAG: non-homologous end-joining DNA ligase [Akkermansiaceae bacterium]|nr:non-homologous end-joining DNA ligase [Akkermansiaceae bacterium]
MTESPAQFKEAKSAGKPPVKPSCMLAKLCHDPFFEKGWIYERKFDGERCLILVRDGEVTLRSRNGESLNDSYPELHEAFRDQDLSDMVIDGEIVAFKGKVTSFSRLQDRIGIQDPEEARKSSVAVYCYVFDLFHHGKQDLSEVPLLKRKQVLRDTLEFNHRIRYSSHRVRNGEDYYQQAHDKGWEGIMAKEADSTYVHGRSSKWLKFKCGRGQEFVIGGFTDPEGDREGFGALLIGVYDGDEFVYAGKVGTGYDDELLRSLRERMDRLERMTSPFDRGDAPDDGVHFVRPELVCEIGFTEWTDDGRLRHPRFKGLRRDKNPEDVTRESP